MDGTTGWIVVVAAIAAIGISAPAVVAGRLSARRRGRLYAEARRTFRVQRERLEAKFFYLAAAAGKPKGWVWSGCDFEDEISYAHDRKTDDVLAMVGLTVDFQPAAPEDPAIIGAPDVQQAATAVFRFRDGVWSTRGRPVFNLDPAETIRRFPDRLDVPAE